MQELVRIGQQLMLAAKDATQKTAKAEQSVEKNANKGNEEAVEAIRTELGLSPIRGQTPMFSTPEEAAAASTDPTLQEMALLDEAIAQWIGQSFEGLD